MKYRKKPVVIEAWQIPAAGEEPTIPPLWLVEAIMRSEVIADQLTRLTQIKTLEGVMAGNPGDWIIQGVKGELYPCKNDIFKATYEAVT